MKSQIMSGYEGLDNPQKREYIIATEIILQPLKSAIDLLYIEIFNGHLYIRSIAISF